MVSILFYNFIEFIVLLYIFLIISFARYKEYMICLISFSTFSIILPAFTCAGAIDNLLCLGVSILSYLWLKILRLEIVRSQTLKILQQSLNNLKTFSCGLIFLLHFFAFLIFSLILFHLYLTSYFGPLLPIK